MATTLRGDGRVGHKFSLVLSREITDDESVVLQEAGCAGATFATDSLPTNADITVTKMDFDDEVSPSLAEAIESALEAVKKVPDLSVPGLTVPAQPTKVADEEPGASVEPSAAVEVEPSAAVEEKPSAKKASVKKASARKTRARKADATPAAELTAAANGAAAAEDGGAGSADDATDPAEGAESD
jgi:hypothetical protein